MYSQSDEESFILDFFKDRPAGRVLDIGAYHATTFSNSRALIEKGWSAVLVEPSPRCFVGLMEAYRGNDRVKLVNACIGAKLGIVDFHDSEGAVATIHQENYERWKGVQLDFQKIVLPIIPAQELIYAAGMDFDFITIDCEGNDYDVIQSLPLSLINPSLICVEYSAPEIFQYLASLGYSLLHQNQENILMHK